MGYCWVGAIQGAYDTVRVKIIVVIIEGRMERLSFSILPVGNHLIK